jgi:hypothetical protein
MARWSRGQDGGLSRRKQEFDSPTGHHEKTGPGGKLPGRGIEEKGNIV